MHWCGLMYSMYPHEPECRVLRCFSWQFLPGQSLFLGKCVPRGSSLAVWPRQRGYLPFNHGSCDEDVSHVLMRVREEHQPKISQLTEPLRNARAVSGNFQHGIEKDSRYFVHWIQEDRFLEIPRQGAQQQIENKYHETPQSTRAAAPLNSFLTNGT